MRPLKWTVEAAGREFKLAQNTVRKILHQGDAKPDATGCYSTEQICACLYGDLRAERLRKERELVRKYRLENEATEGNLLDRAALTASFAELADAMKQAVMHSGMPREACENFLHNLATWPLRLETVARRQSKLSRKRNGQKPEADEDGDEG
jgi:hypothetical protein